MTYCFPNATGGGFACFTVTARPFALLVLNNQSRKTGFSSNDKLNLSTQQITLVNIELCILDDEFVQNICERMKVRI